MNNRFRVEKNTFFRFVINVFLLLALCMVFIAENNKSIIYDGWNTLMGWGIVLLFVFQLFTLFRCGYRIASFQVIFLVFMYIFMLGRVILSGVFGVDSVFSEGYNRDVISLANVSEKEFMNTALFIICCIQAIVCGFITHPSEENSRKINSDIINNKLYTTGIIILFIGVPCHLIYSIRMILSAQVAASYNAITESSGLIDDFANFIIPGLLCVLFSNRLTRKKMTFFYGIVIAYFLVVMVLTGDRRYQAVGIVVLFLAYIVKFDVKFSWRYLLFLAAGIVMLNIFTVIREIRNFGLLSLTDFLRNYGEHIFTLKSDFVTQSLYEFGVSIYSVAFAIDAIPASSGFRLGATFIRAILLIIPAGFLYQNMEIVKFGGIASAVEKYSGHAIGGAMIGDLYGNFGFFGAIVCSIFCGVIMRRLLRIRNNYNVELEYVKYFTLFYSMIHLARASFSEVIRNAVWCVLVVYFIYRLVGGSRFVDKSAD